MFIVRASVLSVLFSFPALAQHYTHSPQYVNPKAPTAPAMRQVVTPDGRVVQLGQTVPQQRMPSSFETTRFPARMIYLNGQNVSSLKNQELENVHIKVDENGNLFITAPHYEVSTDSSYHPLLPSELPQFSKDRVRIENLPQGVFSKSNQAKLPEMRLPVAPSEMGNSRPNLGENPPPIAPPSDSSVKPTPLGQDTQAVPEVR